MNQTSLGYLNDRLKKNLKQLVDMAQPIHDDFDKVKLIRIDHLNTVMEGGGCTAGLSSNDQYMNYLRGVAAAGRMSGGKKNDTFENDAPAFSKKREEDDDDDDDMDFDGSLDLDGSDDELGFDMETWEQNRPRKRNVEADKAFNALDAKIMEVLDVDADTARVYKILAKHAVIQKNPELKKPANDPLKIKEMEKLIANKTKLKALTKNIDLEELKSKIKARYAEVEKLRSEKKAKPQQSRYNNYLESSEIIFSDEE